MSRLISDDTFAIITIAGEAANQRFEGKLGVAEVIRNRTTKLYSSDGTVASTVLRPLQFSCWNAVDKGRLRMCTIEQNTPLYADCMLAWQKAKAGSDTVHGAVLYFNPAIVGTPRWVAACDLTATIQDHLFYKPKSQL